MKKVFKNGFISGSFASIFALIILTVKDIIAYGWQGVVSVLTTFFMLLPICIIICILVEAIKYKIKVCPKDKSSERK